MPRQKKPTYEYVEKLGRYRKRIKGMDGKYVAIYGVTPEELAERIYEAQRQIEDDVFRRDNHTMREHVQGQKLHSGAPARRYVYGRDHTR